MNQDEAIALFEKCEAARKAELDAGSSEDEAHGLAMEVWNSWAELMLAEREELERRGWWRADQESGKADGINERTGNWLSRAFIDFSSLHFRLDDKAGHMNGRERGNGSDNVVEYIRLISCYGSSIRCDGYIFPGDADFANSVFTDNVTFRNAVFSGKTGFTNTVFSSRARFEGAQFLDDALFARSTFCDQAEFVTTEFTGNAEFADCRFDGNTDFVNSGFSADADFSGVTFRGPTSFWSTVFSGDSDFSETSFSGQADFRRSVFDRDLDFSKSKFSDEATFLDSAFWGTTDFSGSAFADEVDFARCRFSDKTFFGSTTYAGSASFDSATFSDDVQFNSAIFSGNAWFGSTVFAARANFAGTAYTGDADFWSSRFSSDADFTGSRFSGNTDFARSGFSGRTCFRKSVFAGNTDFDFAVFNGHAQFQDCIFRSDAGFNTLECRFSLDLSGSGFCQAPDFRNAGFCDTEPPGLDRVRVDRRPQWTFGYDPDPDLAAKFRKLKNMAAMSRYSEGQLEFHAQELRSSRFVRIKEWPVPKIWSPAFWIGLLYGILSDYGRSVARPIIAWCVFVLLFATIYLGHHPPQHSAADVRTGSYWSVTVLLKNWQTGHNCMTGDLQQAGQLLVSQAGIPDDGLVTGAGMISPEPALFRNTDPRREAVYLSVRNSFVFWNRDQPDATRLFGCLYGLYETKTTVVPIIPRMVSFAGIIQNILSIILVFLLGLGLWNMLKLR